ncbi:MAG: GntR family transcriptional regulator [Acetobacteraceae bacterium]
MQSAKECMPAAAHSASANVLAAMVAAVKLDIIFGRLRPRERLIEDEIGARFGASRHLTRSAFAELERLGLVTRRPNKGAIVRDFSVREVEEIYDMRTFLQAEAVRRMRLPAAPALLATLEAVHARYCEAISQRNLQKVCTLNNEFHRTIFGACNNRYLAEIIERMWTETLAIRCYAIGDPILLQRSQREHTEMIQALERGDRKALVRVTVAHIYPALEADKHAHGGWMLEEPPVLPRPAPEIIEARS